MICIALVTIPGYIYDIIHCARIANNLDSTFQEPFKEVTGRALAFIIMEKWGAVHQDAGTAAPVQLSVATRLHTPVGSQS